jgi:hypothetical protein
MISQNSLIIKIADTTKEIQLRTNRTFLKSLIRSQHHRKRKFTIAIITFSSAKFCEECFLWAYHFNKTFATFGHSNEVLDYSYDYTMVSYIEIVICLV